MFTKSILPFLELHSSQLLYIYSLNTFNKFISVDMTAVACNGRNPGAIPSLLILFVTCSVQLCSVGEAMPRSGIYPAYFL